MTMIRSGLPGTASVIVTLAPLLSRISLTFFPCFPMMILASWVTMRARIWIEAAAVAAAAASELALAASGFAGRSGFAAATVAETDEEELFVESTFIGADSSAFDASPPSVCISAEEEPFPFELGSSSSISSLSGAAVAWLAFFDDESAEGEEERERLRAMSALVGARESAISVRSKWVSQDRRQGDDQIS